MPYGRMYEFREPMMMIRHMVVLVALGLAINSLAPAEQAGSASEWSIYITNDNCPDYTWGFTEEQTRQAFADIVRAHLDEMKRTDNQPPENRDHYNMAVMQEALCFVERYPERKEELIRRIKEGRVYVSPFLCNSLWGFQGTEAAIRTLYPARRLERDWGISFEVAEHIEEPSLPWGNASILAGCGIRWLSVPFYNFDSTYKTLNTPPLFIYEGPDGATLRVVMDPWASNKSSYMQGAKILRDLKTIPNDWLPHYRQLGTSYPLRAILASGTHGDISPNSGQQARGFADAIIQYNAQAGDHPKLINATLSRFCKAVDDAQAKSPFLPTVRGCFGHSWDAWPVSLAKYVADLREGERGFLAAESLAAVAALRRPDLIDATRRERERAECCWAMLGDHAWNGTNQENKRHNADLRRRWSEELNARSRDLAQKAWAALGLKADPGSVVLFNSLSIPRPDLVRLEVSKDIHGVADGPRALPSQIMEEDGHRYLYFISPEVPGYGFRQLQLISGTGSEEHPHSLRATLEELESPYYRLRMEFETGGIGSLFHKTSNRELLPGARGEKHYSLCQTVHSSGTAYALTDGSILANGPVFARLLIRGEIGDIKVTEIITLYSQLDRVDVDMRIRKPATAAKEHICHLLPVAQSEAIVRIDTTGAVIRPKVQPEGDLIAGADTRRFAIQGFVDLSLPNGGGITLAPLDAFLLRCDMNPMAIEALGNDQNYREVTQDQHGIGSFRYRYSVRGHSGSYNNAETVAWSRSVAIPLLAAIGRLPEREASSHRIAFDSTRAVGLCLKPADDGTTAGLILRLWETAGRTAPLVVDVNGYRRVWRTDLLERNLEELKIENGKTMLALRANGFAAVRLMP